MTKKEIVLLEKKFYKHMADIFLEMTKSLLISKKDMMRRFKFNNIKALTQFEKKDQNILDLRLYFYIIKKKVKL